MSRILGLIAAAVILSSACVPQSSPSAPKPGQSGAGSTSNWDQVLAAAKGEGQVAVAGPIGTPARDALTDPFQAKYGINVEFLGISDRELAPRLGSERSAGQYRWDVRIGGAMLDAIKPMGALDPIESALILPEVTDPKQWRDGQLEFLDPERSILVMTPTTRGTVFVNPNLVDPASIKSYKDLLDPKWKGKIVSDDPRVSGPGNATYTFFYRHPDLGPEFIRALAKQEVVFIRDHRQKLDMVAQGKYPITIGAPDSVAEPLIAEGAPLVIVDPRQLKEGSDVSPANGEVALFNQAPHPNAASVYINWLLSKEGQTAFVRAQSYVSNRLDVPIDHVQPWRVPQPGAIRTYTVESITLQAEKLKPLLEELFGK